MNKLVVVAYGLTPDQVDELMVGVRTGSGAYDWSPATTYSGGFVKTIFSLWDSPLMPAQMQDLIVFNEDKGTAWIEANY